MEWVYFAVYFQGFFEPILAEAAALCLPVGIGLVGTVNDIFDLVGLCKSAEIRPGVERFVVSEY